MAPVSVTKKEKVNTLRAFLVELAVYAVFVTAYFFLVLHFLSDWLQDLQNLPVDTLKIDRSFVRGMKRDGGRSEIVHAIIALAHSLKMRVVGEGVETREQLDALADLHCDGAQGFSSSRR